MRLMVTEFACSFRSYFILSRKKTQLKLSELVAVRQHL